MLASRVDRYNVMELLCIVRRNVPHTDEFKRKMQASPISKTYFCRCLRELRSDPRLTEHRAFVFIVHLQGWANNGTRIW